MLKILYAGCLGLSPAILAQFTLECVPQPEIAKKFTKTPYFGGSWSFKFIDVDISKKIISVLVMISSMFMPICNHFHARRGINSRIMPF